MIIARLVLDEVAIRPHGLHCLFDTQEDYPKSCAFVVIGSHLLIVPSHKALCPRLRVFCC